MIHIRVLHAWLIGDALCHVPWMDFLCRKHNTEAVVSGEFNEHVRMALGDNYRFEFIGESKDKADVQLSMASMLGYSGQTHMSTSFFRQRGEPEPTLPITLDLKRDDCGLRLPGIVIAPFSRSDMNGNKLWPHENWIRVLDDLRAVYDMPAYVVGSSADDPSLYEKNDVVPYFDHPLSQVLDLLLKADLFLSIDTGIAHLAHFGGVVKHVMLYPACTPMCWAQNPMAYKVIGWPSQVVPKDIVDVAFQVLG